MKIKGKLHRITDLKTFIASYIATGGKPTVGFTHWGKARVHLATDIPSGQFSGGFPPSMSFKTDANGRGEFGFDAPSMGQFRGRIVAFKTTTVPNPMPGLPPLPILDPVYRSAPFKFSDISAAEQTEVQRIYIFEATTPTESGISQKELDGKVAELRKDVKLDKLRATILSSRVSVKAEKSGGDLKFCAFVRGSTSADLDRVIEIKAGEIDIDLPGPDFIVGLCIDEDEIEAQIRKGLSTLSKKISGELINELERQAPGVGSKATLSVWRTRFVKTGRRTIVVPGAPDVEVPVFTVVPDAAVGLPRRLY